MPDIVIKILPIAVVALIVIIIFVSGYVKAPTNEAYIISGLKKEPRVLIGRAGIKVPFLERKDSMIIKQISIDIKTNGYIPTQDFIGVDIDAIAKVHVITYKDVTVDANGNYLPNIAADDNTPKITKTMAMAAMKNFLNMTEDEIKDALTDSLQGNMREIIGTQTLKDLCNDRKGFGDQVQDKAQKDMNALGIRIVSCNIQKLEDEKGLIIALGQDNMSKIQKDASIAKAQADAEVAIAEANARKSANDARVAADTEIARKQNELEITKANLKIDADTKQAEADAAYKIQEENQRRSIEIAQANADIAKQDREIELKEKVASVKERELDANVRKQAEAEKYAKQQAAEAELFERQKKAEAELFEEQKKAEAVRTQAEAQAYAAKQKAEAIKAQGEADAEAIRAKGLAEAEALDKKAEAMSKYGKAAMTEMVVKILPDMAKAIAEPIGAVDKISIIDGGSGEGANSMYNMVAGGLAKTIEAVKETTGLDLTEVMKANTYDAKVNRNVNINGLDGASNKKSSNASEENQQ
ncbi:MAG: flotillin family protein [Butyrivibrio sp.]